MTIEDILNDARSVVKKVVPDHVEITQVDFEGPTIVIYTKNMEVFAESNDLVRQIAKYLRTINDERQSFLKQVGRRLAREVPAGENYVRITALGGFRQVGRSAALLSTRESKVLIDCGVLISEDNGSPYLNAPEVLPLTSLDAVVITHAHLDHSGLVPALFKYGYEGRS